MPLGHRHALERSRRHRFVPLSFDRRYPRHLSRARSSYLRMDESVRREFPSGSRGRHANVLVAFTPRPGGRDVRIRRFGCACRLGVRGDSSSRGVGESSGELLPCVRSRSRGTSDGTGVRCASHARRRACRDPRRRSCEDDHAPRQGLQRPGLAVAPARSSLLQRDRGTSIQSIARASAFRGGRSSLRSPCRSLRASEGRNRRWNGRTEGRGSACLGVASSDRVQRRSTSSSEGVRPLDPRPFDGG